LLRGARPERAPLLLLAPALTLFFFFWSPLRPAPSKKQDTVNFPVHMKNFNMQQLKQLTKELRSEVVNVVSKTGGEKRAELLERA
jgi:hypothetical protein